MAELVAIWIACKNIGDIARARGVPAQPFQIRAVILWIIFEFVFLLAAGALGLQGVFLYLAAFAGALLSLRFSFGAVRAAVPKQEVTTVDTASPDGTVLENE